MEKDDLYKRLDLVNNWISNVDAKTSFALSFIGVLIGFIISNDLFKNTKDVFTKIYSDGIKSLAWSGYLNLTIVSLFLFFTGKALFCLYNSLKGRIDSKIYEESGLEVDSNIFWGTISKKAYCNFYDMSNKEFKEEDLVKDIISQTFINSKICNEKFLWYNKGLFWTICTFGIFLLHTILQCIKFI